MKRVPRSLAVKHKARAEAAIRRRYDRTVHAAINRIRQLSALLDQSSEQLADAHNVIPREVPAGPLPLRVGVLVHTLDKAGQMMLTLEQTLAQQEIALRNAAKINRIII